MSKQLLCVERQHYTAKLRRYSTLLKRYYDIIQESVSRHRDSSLDEKAAAQQQVVMGRYCYYKTLLKCKKIHQLPSYHLLTPTDRAYIDECVDILNHVDENYVYNIELCLGITPKLHQNFPHNEVGALFQYQQQDAVVYWGIYKKENLLFLEKKRQQEAYQRWLQVMKTLGIPVVNGHAAIDFTGDDFDDENTETEDDFNRAWVSYMERG